MTVTGKTFGKNIMTHRCSDGMEQVPEAARKQGKSETLQLELLNAKDRELIRYEILLGDLRDIAQWEIYWINSEDISVIKCVSLRQRLLL